MTVLYGVIFFSITNCRSVSLGSMLLGKNQQYGSAHFLDYLEIHEKSKLAYWITYRGCVQIVCFVWCRNGFNTDLNCLFRQQQQPWNPMSAQLELFSVCLFPAYFEKSSLSPGFTLDLLPFDCSRCCLMLLGTLLISGCSAIILFSRLAMCVHECLSI